MPQPIRLLLLTTELGYGGAEKNLTRIATGLDREHFDPVVCSIAPLPKSRRNLVDALERAGVPVCSLEASRGRNVIAARRRLRSLVAEKRPDVVQTFLFHANVLAASSIPRGAASLVAGYRVADPRVWRTTLERWALSRAERAVCVSDAVRDFYVDRRGFPSSKLSVIANAVDVPDVATLETPADYPGPESGRTRAIFVGRLHRQKGLDLGLRWIDAAVRAGGDVQWALVGDGPERDALISEAKRLGIEDRIHFVGWKPDVDAWLAASDLFLLPSRWEGMPNALMEAFAVGLPALATNVEGTSEILGDLSSPQLVSADDPDGATAKLAALLRDDEERRRLGAANRLRMIENFRPDAIVERYADLYRAVARR